MNERLITRLALEVSQWHRQSKLAVERLVRKTEGWQTNTTLKFKVNSVYDLAQSIIEKRKYRAKPHAGKTIYERFNLVKRKKFLDAVRQAGFRVSTTDIHITRVNFVSDVNKVSIECNEVKTRRDGKVMSVHDFFPYISWHKLPKHLRVIEGKITLYASKKTDEKGVEVYDAIWCQQGHGTSIKLVQGCIAVQQANRKTCASHVEGVWEPDLRLKAIESLVPVAPAPQRKQREFSFMEEMYANRIKIKEPLKKIEKWCWSVGLNPDSTRITLGDLIRGYWVQPNQRIKTLVRRIFSETKAGDITTNSIKVGEHRLSMN